MKYFNIATLTPFLTFSLEGKENGTIILWANKKKDYVVGTTYFLASIPIIINALKRKFFLTFKQLLDFPSP